MTVAALEAFCRVHIYSAASGNRHARLLCRLDDERLVIRGRRDGSGRTIIDVDRHDITSAMVKRRFRAPGKSFRPVFGRSVVCLTLDHNGDEVLAGLVLKHDDAAAWSAQLTSASH